MSVSDVLYVTCYESNRDVRSIIYEPHGNAMTHGEIVDMINGLLDALRSARANERRWKQVLSDLTVERDASGKWHWCLGWLKQMTEAEAAACEQVADVRKAFTATIDAAGEDKNNERPDTTCL